MKQYVFFSNDNVNYQINTSAYPEVATDMLTISDSLNDCIVTEQEKKFLLTSVPTVMRLVERGVVSFAPQDNRNTQTKKEQAKIEYYNKVGPMICKTLNSLLTL